jgi:hypothetical protein
MTPPTPDPIQDAAVNLQVLLRHLLERAQEAVTDCEKTRESLRKNVDDLLASRGSTPPGEILDDLVNRTQALFGEGGEVTVGRSEDCAGAEGLGVSATKVGTNAGTKVKYIVTACVTGSLETEGITGGRLVTLHRY